jgi:hypothetical protein
MKLNPNYTEHQIIKYLQDGNTLTALQALSMFGHNRLSNVICDMNNAGVKVKSTMVEVIGMNGKIKRVAEYKINV